MQAEKRNGRTDNWMGMNVSGRWWWRLLGLAVWFARSPSFSVVVVLVGGFSVEGGE